MTALNKKGQLSLEYMILLAAFFSALLIFMPLLINIQSLGIFAEDVKSAELFLSNIKNSADALLLFGNGSKKSLESPILTSWTISSSQNKLFLKVKSTEPPKEKLLEIELNEPISIEEKTFENSISLVLQKESDIISLTYH